MRKDDEISSTEKLLDVIRHGNEKSAGNPNEPVAVADNIPQVSTIERVFSFSKKVTAGLVFARKSITILILNQVSDHKWQLINYASIEDKPGINRKSTEFKQHLRTSLTRLLEGRHKDVDIWAAVPSERVEMRHLIIPKVPDDQVANAVFWNFSKLAQMNERDVIFDFNILDEIEEDKKKKLRVATYAAPRKEIEELKTFLSDIGFSPKGISIVPFAVQNMFRADFIETGTNHICTLFIGRDWSRIDIFTDGDLVLSRVIKTGINSIVEAIRSKLHEELEEAEAIFNHLIKDESLSEDDRETGYNINEDDVFEAIMPVLERLVRQVERTIGHFSLNFGSDSIANVFLSGKTTGNVRLTERIERLMPYSIQPVDPFTSDKLSTGNIEIPASALERDSFLPAMGLALSSNSRTPNFLFTFKDKNTLSNIEKINRNVFIIFLIITVMCLGLFYWQEVRISDKKDSIQALKQEIARYSPQVDLELLRNITVKTVSNRQKTALVAERYFNLAVFQELSELVPGNIKLLSVRADLGRHHAGNKKYKKTFLMEGIVNDLPSERETTLAVFMLKLNESPIFGTQSEMIVKKVEQFDGKEVLRFSARMELING